MRKLLLWFVMFSAFTIVNASPSDAIEVFTSDGNSVSLSTAGKIFYLNMASGAAVYDSSSRIIQVGNVAITYSGVNRVSKIGNDSINYDASNRINKIGDIKIAYDFANRISKIGDAAIAYDVVSRITRITGKTPDNLRFVSVIEQPQN